MVAVLVALLLYGCGGAPPVTSEVRAVPGRPLLDCPYGRAASSYAALSPAAATFAFHLAAFQASGARDCKDLSARLLAQVGTFEPYQYIEVYTPDGVRQETYFYAQDRLVSLFIIDRARTTAPCEVVWYGIDLSGSWRGATVAGALLGEQLCVPY